jgi:hypothetical protein
VGQPDDRTADQRRLDAFRDLMLGRDQLPLVADHMPLPVGGCDGSVEPCPRCLLRAVGAAPCGCLAGQPAPCGADISVLLPIGAGLGTTDEVAELAGHGPLEPDLLEQLLSTAPGCGRCGWTKPASRSRSARRRRGWSAATRQRCGQRCSRCRPSRRRPSRNTRWTIESPLPRLPLRTLPRDRCCPTRTPPTPPAPTGRRAGCAGWSTCAPRCEWPGCGARAVHSDTEHDRAWPDGPTCACNLGPCCRKHHRIKQLGWTKTRGHGPP